MRKYGFFKTIGFFVPSLLILLGENSGFAAMNSQQRRELWLLKQDANQPASEMAAPERRELIEGCTDSVEAYCSQLQKELGIHRAAPVIEAEEEEPRRQNLKKPKRKGHGVYKSKGNKKLRNRAEYRKKRQPMVLKARRNRPAGSEPRKG